MAGTTTTRTRTDGFSAAERAAMKERAAEARAEKRGGKNADRTPEVLAKIASMQDADRVLAERIHEIVTTTAPELAPRLYYGMPAYAKDGKVLCFFQDSAKFGYRYCTLGFQDVALLDDGNLWPTSYALTTLTAAEEKTVASLVRRAVGAG